MRQGLLLQGITALAEVPAALMLNVGVRFEQAADEETPRLFARGPWLPATDDERELLCARRPVPLPDAITIVALDPALRDDFWEHVGPWVCRPEQTTPEDRQRRLWDYGHKVASALATATGIRATALRSCDVQVTPSHRESTAYDYQNNRYVGLHIDNHDRLLFRERRDAFQLVCLNVGPAERYLHCVNLAVPDLLAALGHDTASAEKYFPSARHLIAAFFAQYPDYPIMRVTLPPNHAYIAVTQFVIHDGATDTVGQPDVAFLLGGHFAGAW